MKQTFLEKHGPTIAWTAASSFAVFMVSVMVISFIVAMANVVDERAIYHEGLVTEATK